MLLIASALIASALYLLDNNTPEPAKPVVPTITTPSSSPSAVKAVVEVTPTPVPTSNYIVDLINAKRQEAGVPTLSQTSRLNTIALTRAKFLVENNIWGHDGFLAQARDFDPLAKHGENLARYFANANQVVEAWIASPSHRDNVLGSKYHSVGLGRYQDYWVVWFSSRY